MTRLLLNLYEIGTNGMHKLCKEEKQTKLTKKKDKRKSGVKTERRFIPSTMLPSGNTHRKYSP